ncbi:hypothetical protein BT63DRAFT_191847 [Microthyrium microscopicum]|uniref:Uncharacterized protein n=1 Tax=Microthyrium microscopicum TaxID=703497 RepID=A0A6A6UJ27_9PEZI|nr:hypothetical protein BT63DRAFT_191847 [Microthyrium microscopicum]
MLSLPYLPPRDDFWSSSPFRPIPLGNEDTTSNNRQHASSHGNQQQTSHQHNHHHHNAAHRPAVHVHHARTQALLNQLIADEQLIEQRKQNVRRFGANWIRPPGVAKTLQARIDEDIERREQAELQRREERYAEERAAQAAQMPEGQEQLNEAGERDLDEDIPDADAMEMEDEDDEDDEDEDESDEENSIDNTQATGHAPSRFNEESLLEGSLVGGIGLVGGDGFSPSQTQGYLDAEDAELDGRAQDMRDLGIDRDLDEDIPEAGSYQHTDTEEETSSDDDSGMEDGDGGEDVSVDQAELDRSVGDMLETSFVSYTRSSDRRRRSGVRRGRWSGVSDVVMETSEIAPSPSSSNSAMMRRLRAARRFS